MELTTWTSQVDACCDALKKFYITIETSRVTNTEVVIAINNLKAVGKEIMRATPKWEKVFKTASIIIKNDITMLAVYKLANEKNIAKAVNALNIDDLIKLVNDIIMQDAHW